MTTTSGVETSELGGIESAADAFLASFKLPADADEQPSDEETRKKPTEQSEHSEPEETSSEADESPSEQEETEGEEQPEQKKDKKSFVDSDDVYVKVKVGDQEHETSVKDLKRLFGQEAALTRRSQEVAAERKAIENRGLQYGTKLDRMIKTVTAKADEYRKLDFISLARNPNFSQEQLAILQDEARKTFEEEAYLKGELKEFSENAQKEQTEIKMGRARECVKHLTDEASPYYIEGFDAKVYTGLKEFALSQGVPEEIANEIIDAPLVKLLHMAMMYNKGASKVTTKVVNKTPKKIVKTSSTPPSAPPKNVTKAKAAMKAHKKSGSLESATNAFLAGWETTETE